MVSVLYAETAIFCAIIIALIYNRTSDISDFSKSGNYFVNLLSFSLAFCLVDAAWGFEASEVIYMGVTAYKILTYAFHTMASVTVFIWFLFCLKYLGKPFSEKKVWKIIPIVLLLIELSLIFSNLFLDNVFIVTFQHIYITKPCRLYLFILQFLNFFIMFCLSVFCTVKEKDIERKKFLRNAIYFSLVPFITGIMQFVFPDAPVYSLGFTLSSFAIYAFVITYEHTNLVAEYKNEKTKTEYQQKLRRNYAIISSLAGSYDYIGLIYLSSNRIKNIRVSGLFSKYISQGQEYIEPKSFDLIIKSIIPKRNIKQFLRHIDRKAVLDGLKNEERFLYDFIAEEEKKVIHYRIYFAYDSDDSQCVVVGIRNVGKEYSMLDKIKEQKEKIRNLEQQNEMTALMANIDGLTALLNKMSFIEKVERYITENSSINCALIFFDMDHFKSINDVFGHERGDAALREMAIKLKAMFRTDELIARMGGDEFCIFLPNISLSIVEKRIDQMNEKLIAVYEDDNATIKTSASIGCVYCKEQNLSYAELHNIADKAMYEVKNNGRNGNSIKVF